MIGFFDSDPGTVTIAGVTLPAPRAAPLPPLSPPPARPSLMARLGHALAAAGEAISDRIRPAAPLGYEGLLPPDEIERARPSLLRTLIGAPDAPSAEELYRTRLDTAIQRRALGEQMRRQQEIADARRALIVQLPPPADDTQLPGWAAQILPRLVQIGDIEGVQMLSPLAKVTPPRAYEPQLFQGPNGEMRYFAPDEQTQIPAGWKPVSATSGNLGTPQLFRGPNGDYVGIAPGDNDALAKYSAMGYKPEVTARTEFVQANVGERFDATQSRIRMNRFMIDTKPLRDRAHVIDQAITTIEDAAHHPDPRVRQALYSSAVANFVQAADQKAQIRIQLLKYFKDNVDPSVAGRWNLLKERLLKGSLPQYTMEGMLIHLQNLRRMTAEQFDAQRRGIVERYPEMDAVLPSAEEFFPGLQQQPPAATATKPSVAERDAQLKAQGLKADERRRILRSEGYNVR